MSFIINPFVFGVTALPVLLEWEPETAQALPATATFTRASVAQVLTTTDGTTNWYQEADSGELRLDGLRRVEQRLIGSHDFANAAWTASNITVNGGTELVASGATPNISQAIASLPIGEYIFAIKVSLTAGSISADGDVSIDFAGTSLDIGDEITGSPQVIQVRHSEATGGSLTATLNIASGLTLEVAFGHVEYVGGRTTDVFGAEVDDSIEYLNVGVNGVLYLNTDQANTAAGSGVVTEAAGTTITGGGYLPEPAATNQMPTVELSDGVWTKTNITVTDNGINDLGLNEYELDAGTATGGHRTFDNASSAAAGSAYIIAKEGTGRYICLLRGTTNGSDYACFDLQLGTITEEGGGIDDALITNLGNGWYKCEVNTSDTAALFQIGISDTATPGAVNPSFTGANETILVCHAQYENTTFSTSPIITSGSTVTRVADSLDAVTLTEDCSAFADATAAAVLETDGSYNYLFGSGGATITSLMRIRKSTSTLFIRFGGTNVHSNNVTYTAAARIKWACSYNRAATTAAVGNTGDISETTSAPDVDWTTITASVGGNTADPWRGRIHNVIIYGTSQTQAQLEALVA